MRTRRSDWPVALLGLVLTSTMATVGFVGAAYDGAELARQRDAPSCRQDQRFTAAECQFTLDGTIVAVSPLDVHVVAEGHQIVIAAKMKHIYGQEGTRIRLTFYRGEPVRLVGPAIDVDATDTPGDRLGYDQAFQFLGVAGGAVSLVALLLTLPPRRTVRAPR